MAIAVDVANIGTADSNSSTTSLAFNTTATVASNGFIVAQAGGWFTADTLTSVSGGGLTWSVDASGDYSGGNPQYVAIASAQAPSGLASGTTLTFNFSGSVQYKTVGAMSFTGVAASSALDVAGTDQEVAGTLAWSTGSLSVAAGSVIVGFSWNEGASSGSTITGPSVEAWEDLHGDGFGATAGYQIVAAGGSASVAGTWGAGTTHLDIGAAYLAAAGAAAPVMARPFNPIPFLN